MDKLKSFSFTRRYRIQFSQRRTALLGRNQPIKMVITMDMHDFQSLNNKEFLMTFSYKFVEIFQFYLLIATLRCFSVTYLKPRKERDAAVWNLQVVNTVSCVPCTILYFIEIA